LHTQNGAFAFADREYQATGTFLPLSISEAKVDKRFLFWALHVRVPSLSASDTVGRETYKTRDILALEIPLPLLAEQRRIAARIDTLAAQIAEAYALRHQASLEISGLLPGAAANLFEAMTFGRRPLSEVAYKRTGIAYRAEDFVEAGDVPVVRLREIGTRSPTVYLRNQHDYPNVWLEPGDIVLAKTSFSTGAMCQWPGPPAVLNQNAVMLRANADVEQRYLYAWLGHQVSRYLADHLADPKFYPYIRESDLMRWEVPLPPLGEQRQIVAYLDGLREKVDALKRLQAESAAELDALLPALLDRAFKGEL
jgi:type I restriction enzyme S subunit